jgi:hypothetical protein
VKEPRVPPAPRSHWPLTMKWGESDSRSAAVRGGPSIDRPAHHRVTFPHLDRFESACVVHGSRAAEMAGVTLLGFVMGIALNTRRTASGSIRDHAIEQCRGDPVPSERRAMMKHETPITDGGSGPPGSTSR